MKQINSIVKIISFYNLDTESNFLIMFSSSNTSLPRQLEEFMYQWYFLPLFLFYFPMKIPLEEVHITVDVQLRGYGVIFISPNKLSQCLN